MTGVTSMFKMNDDEYEEDDYDEEECPVCGGFFQDGFCHSCGFVDDD